MSQVEFKWFLLSNFKRNIWLRHYLGYLARSTILVEVHRDENQASRLDDFEMKCLYRVVSGYFLKFVHLESEV